MIENHNCPIMSLLTYYYVEKLKVVYELGWGVFSDNLKSTIFEKKKSLYLNVYICIIIL